MRFCEMFSPNFNVGRNGCLPDMIVLHTTGNTTQSAINTVMNSNNSVSYHFLIAENGDITQLVDIFDTAWHSGITNFVRSSEVFKNKAHFRVQDRTNSPNDYTIGIGFGDMNLNRWVLTDEQVLSARVLIRYIRDEVKRRLGYRISLTREYIIGHSDINPLNRANCPGDIQWGEIMDGLDDEVAYWAVEGVQWVQRNGVSDGLRPNEFVTRQEVMQMFFNYDQKRKIAE